MPSQPGGCARCHPGLGPKPNPVEALTEADTTNIDCLICHGPDYRRDVAALGQDEQGKPIFGLVPAEGVDVTNLAQNAQRPTSAMCLRCHTSTGGGPNAKHGVIPTVNTDVHMAAGLACVDCHTTVEHKIAGGADIKAREPLGEVLEGVSVACSNCHTEAPHAAKALLEGLDLPLGQALNNHTDYLACQTCHIPMIARDPDMPTVVYRDYGRPVLNEKTGLYGPFNQWEGNVMPEYSWWNGQMRNPPEPIGGRGDGVIAPWKRATYNIPVDAASEQPVYVKLGAYFISGSLDVGVAKGVEAWSAGHPDYEYSGEYEMAEESMVFSVNHQVAPAAQALGCQDCHTAQDGRLDFAALGYAPEEVAVLTSFPPVVVESVQAQPTAEPTEAPIPEPTEETAAPAPTQGLASQPGAREGSLETAPAPVAANWTLYGLGAAGLLALAVLVIYLRSR